MKFVCFSTTDLRPARDALVSDAKALGIFSDIEVWDEKRLVASPEYMSLPQQLREGRGFGFFWWKPYIIRLALESVSDGDLVFYSDCGRYDGGFRLGAGLLYLLKRYSSTGFAGVEVPQFGAAKRWTRVECIEYFSNQGVEFIEQPQIQATFACWKKTDDSLKIIKEWEKCCREIAFVSDVASEEMGNQGLDFIEHRHDQSILTALVRKYKIPYISLSKKWQYGVLRILSRSRAANVEMKKTDFVAHCLKSNSLFLPLFLVYFKNKFLKRKKQ